MRKIILFFLVVLCLCSCNRTKSTYSDHLLLDSPKYKRIIIMTEDVIDE